MKDAETTVAQAIQTIARLLIRAIQSKGQPTNTIKTGCLGGADGLIDLSHAQMAKLADAAASKAVVHGTLRVRPPLWAPQMQVGVAKGSRFRRGLLSWQRPKAVRSCFAAP